MEIQKRVTRPHARAEAVNIKLTPGMSLDPTSSWSTIFNRRLESNWRESGCLCAAFTWA